MPACLGLFAAMSEGARHRVFHKVAELFCGELVSFEVRYQVSPTVNNHGVQRMRHRGFISNIGDAKHVGHFVDCRRRACQESPVSSIGVPDARIPGEGIRLVHCQVVTVSRMRSVPMRRLKRFWSWPKLLERRKQ